MDAKPSGFARLKVKEKTLEGWRLFFKAKGQVGTILLNVDEREAEQFDEGTEYKFTISFERIVHSGPT